MDGGKRPMFDEGVGKKAITPEVTGELRVSLHFLFAGFSRCTLTLW
jgi:hypothetical protein